MYVAQEIELSEHQTVVRPKLNAERKSLSEIAEALRAFLVRVSEAVARGVIFKRHWKRGGAWVFLD